MKYSELIEFAKNYLMNENISDYDTDVFLLMEFVFGMSRTDYFLKMSDIISDEDKLSEYKKLLEIRAEGKPLQYITGHQEFMGLDFKVNENVLIPRYDTEILVETVQKMIEEYLIQNHRGIRQNKDISMLDMCTGSGCIGISIAKLCNLKNVTCVDISKEALAVAEVNAASNAASFIKFVNSDLFANIKGKYDFIVSNPPYIRTDEIAGLMREVKAFEPKLALDGDVDGLKFYKKITEEAVRHLNSGGWLMYEIGCEQGVKVSELMKENGFANVEVIKDLAGLDRVVIGNFNVGGKEDV